MSISSVSNNASLYTQSLQSGQMSSRKQDFSALGSALQSGDLAGAQKAFAALQQDMQGMGQTGQVASSTGSTNQSGTTSMKDLMDQLSKALSSGDLQGSQQAFAAIQQKMQANQSHGHHHHHGGGSQSSSSTTTSAASTTTASNATPTTNISTTA